MGGKKENLYSSYLFFFSFFENNVVELGDRTARSAFKSFVEV